MNAGDIVFYISGEKSLSGLRGIKKTNACFFKMATKLSANTERQRKISMCFSIGKTVQDEFQIIIDQKEIEVVNEFEYLGVTVDPQLKFDAHRKTFFKTIPTSLNCFRLIRSCLSFKAAHLYMHAMIMSHLSHCVTSRLLNQ